MKKKELLLIGIGAALATAATIFFFWIRRNQDNEAKPPKKAPQVPVKNPGDQSEFTTSASESEIG
jgi:hypothetical protein